MYMKVALLLLMLTFCCYAHSSAVKQQEASKDLQLQVVEVSDLFTFVGERNAGEVFLLTGTSKEVETFAKFSVSESSHQACCLVLQPEVKSLTEPGTLGLFALACFISCCAMLRHRFRRNDGLGFVGSVYLWTKKR